MLLQWSSHSFKITSKILRLQTCGKWHRVVWSTGTNFSDEWSAWRAWTRLYRFCVQSGLRIRGGYVSTLPAKTWNSAKICTLTQISPDFSMYVSTLPAKAWNSAKICTLAQISPDVFYVCVNTSCKNVKFRENLYSRPNNPRCFLCMCQHFPQKREIPRKSVLSPKYPQMFSMYVSTLPAKTWNSAKICTLAQISPDVFYVCVNTYATIYN
jgi:hypothetical protein